VRFDDDVEEDEVVLAKPNRAQADFFSFDVAEGTGVVGGGTEMVLGGEVTAVKDCCWELDDLFGSEGLESRSSLCRRIVAGLLNSSGFRGGEMCLFPGYVSN